MANMTEDSECQQQTEKKHILYSKNMIEYKDTFEESLNQGHFGKLRRDTVHNITFSYRIILLRHT